MKRISAKGFTWVACLATVAVFVACASALTSGFQHWTFEEKRVALARRGAYIASSVALTTAQGEVRRLWPDAGRERMYLVDFIYTRCPSVCQVLGSEYQRMQEALRVQGDSGVRLLSISFDARDTDEDLRAYVRRYRAQEELWTIATARDAGAIGRLLRELAIVVVPDGMGGYVHNGDIHLVNGEGELLAIFPYEEWEQALAAATRLARITERGGV